MPDFRQNIITGDWMIVAEDRAARPGAFAPPLAIDDDRDCPFCEGNERETPHESFAVRDTNSAVDGPGWRVRMVPNRYPAVAPIDGPIPITAEMEVTNVAHVPSIPATGVHDVIIESPRHVQSLVELSNDEINLVARSYRDRMRALAAQREIECLVLFKNSGAGAGASLSHVHSQVVGLPRTPPNVASRVARCHAYYLEHGRSLYDDYLADELATGDRVVDTTEGLVAHCPWASRFPAETWIVPRRGPTHFEQLDDREIDAFAALLGDTLSRLETTTSSGPYNFFLHNPPRTEPTDSSARWHFAILPRLANPGGFEWSTGIHINPVSPEHAAGCLRTGSLLQAKQER